MMHLCSLMLIPAIAALRLNMQADTSKQILNKYSRTITEPPSQGASQAMLYGTGAVTPETINNPQVGICSVWFEGNPCNMHLLDLSASVKSGVQSAGLIGYRFNTIGKFEISVICPHDSF